MSPRATRRFVRVYYIDLERDYPQIVSDDGAYATWLRLLVAADKVWPTTPELPKSVKAGPLGRLVASGLVSLLPRHTFSIRGYETERGARQESARNAAALRWQNGRSADAGA